MSVKHDGTKTVSNSYFVVAAKNFAILFRIAVIQKTLLFIASECQIANGLEPS